MTTQNKRLQTLDKFLSTHGHVAANALSVYAERMRGEALPLLAHYEKIKDDPEARAAQDKTLITTNGLVGIANRFKDSADRADKAREALRDLIDDDDDEALDV